jgi:molecular chaperone GrpE
VFRVRYSFGHFVPSLSIGSILDNLTFANNFEKMAEKDTTPQNPENEAGIDINSDESMGGTSHLNNPVENESELDKLRAELEEAKDKYIRKVAEFENFKRRNAKERVELIQTAGKEVIKDMLDVADDCDRAQKQMEASEDIKTIKEGVLLVFNKLRNVLQAKGLKAMDTIGKEFDTDLHEAITEIPAPAPELRGKVVDEVMKGYYLNDKIIRHAKVVVGK